MLNLLPLHGQFRKILGSHYPPNGISWEKPNFIPLSTPTNPFTPILNTQKPCFCGGFLHIAFRLCFILAGWDHKNLWRPGKSRQRWCSMLVPLSQWNPLANEQFPCGVCPPSVDHVPNGIPFFFHIFLSMFTPGYPFWFPFPRPKKPVFSSAKGPVLWSPVRCRGLPSWEHTNVGGIYQWTGLKSMIHRYTINKWIWNQIWKL